jgi:two-component system chemotaxis response regulator CheB
VAQAAGRRVGAALLTGMGSDGAKGLLALRQAGARTFAQDEASCVVFGMPKAAWDLGAAEALVPLDELALKLMRC